MPPSSSTSRELSASAAISHTLAIRSQGSHVQGKTAFGIVFALACFAVITGVYLSRRRQDTVNNGTSTRFERLIRMVRRPQQTQPEATHENNEPISRRPPLAIPPPSRQGPLPQNSGVSTIRDDASVEQSPAVTLS